ncbi:MAG: alpha/beta hydrolase [Polyangiaceae bacterium]
MSAREPRLERRVLADDQTALYVRDEQGHTAHPRRDGLTVILNDGIACDGFIWKYMRGFLLERLRVVHWHYRGHGRSAAPRDRSRVLVKDVVSDLDHVRTAVGDPPCVLIGHSFGCQVALEGFRTRPSTVRGLVLLCGSSGRVTHTFRGTDALAQVLPPLIARVERHPHIARGLWASVPPALSLRVATLTGEIDASLMDPKDLLPYLEHMVDIDLGLFLKMLADAGEHSAEDLLPSIDVPVLVVAGDKDNFTPPRYAEALAKALPKGELVVLPATHVAPIEQRAVVHERIAAFIDALPDTPL